MKKTLILAMALAFSSRLLSAPFEGVARFKTTTEKGKAMEMEFSMGHGKTRVEAEAKKGQKASVIMDTKAKQMIVLMPEKRMYMVHSLDEKRGPKGKAKGTFKKSGKSETILGYKAEEFIYEGEGQATSIWGTSELGSFMGDFKSEQGGTNDLDIPQEFKDKGFFPLRVERKKDGGKQAVMEAVKIEKKALDAAFFEVPSGYEKMEMPGMGMGMGKPGKAKGGMPAGMEEAMKGMTPEQRKMMEEMMKGKKH